METLFLIVAVLIAACALVYKDKKYKKTAYYQITKNPYSSLKHDRGKFGEYLIYKRLKHFEKSGGRFLFNVYIPKNKNATTEIDVILICPKAVFVFESKNYSGWIFGNEIHRNWMQILPQGRGRSHKARFYNPIMQNATHVKYLKRLIGENLPLRSIIVFSDGCAFKDVKVQNNEVTITKSNKLRSVINKICLKTKSDGLTQQKINELYRVLYPYSQVSLETRQQHLMAAKNYNCDRSY